MTSSHFSVSSVRRSRQQSAVAKAAYQSRECLFSEADQAKKDYYKKAGDILAKGIILPDNAPAEYRDRQTLWNAVEKNEKRCDSRLAQTIVMALPEELPKTEYEELIRSYCNEQFVSKGMIADYAIHDNGDSNPHAHIMLTLRTIDENGAWRSKCHRVYDLDENGERIKLSANRIARDNIKDKANELSVLEKKYASISIEANELLECFQWSDDDYDIAHVKEELADVLVYCKNMLDKLGLDEDEIVNARYFRRIQKI